MKTLYTVICACLVSASACASQEEPTSNDEQAVSGSGFTATVLGRATYDKFKVERKNNPEWGGVLINSFDNMDVVVQSFTFQPHGWSGWHNHPGPILVNVTKGAMTFYDSADSDCAGNTVTAGHGAIDGGDVAAMAGVNNTNEVATMVVTYLIPVGAATRTNLPQPANCPIF